MWFFEQSLRFLMIKKERQVNASKMSVDLPSSYWWNTVERGIICIL